MKDTDYQKLFYRFLKGEISLHEYQLIKHWLKSNDFDEWTNRLWHESSDNLSEEDKTKILIKIQEKTKIDSSVFKQRNEQHLLNAFYRVAIVLLLIVSATMTYMLIKQYNNTNMDQVFFVDKGQKARVLLPDSSVVWLNSNSKLTYGSRFSSDERVVSLDGEAYFEVSSNPKRPFIVKTNELDIKVTGTSFNIKAYEEDSEIQTVLIDGRLEVISKNDHFFLIPNECVRFNKRTYITTKENVMDGAIYKSWKENFLYFDVTTLEEVIKVLTRNYNVNILFESESLKSYEIRGMLKNTTLENILQILSLTTPLLYKSEGSDIILYENDKQKGYYNRE